MMTQFFSVRHARGVSMIEVLVAVLVLSIGLLGLAALQGFSLQTGQHAYFRSQAVDLAYELADYARANRLNTLNICALPTVGYWNEVAAERLPGGALDFDVTDCANGEVEITLSWVDERLNEVDDGIETVSFVTRI